MSNLPSYKTVLSAQNGWERKVIQTWVKVTCEYMKNKLFIDELKRSSTCGSLPKFQRLRASSTNPDQPMNPNHLLQVLHTNAFVPRQPASSTERLHSTVSLSVR